MSADRGKERAFDEGWGLTPKEKARLAAAKEKEKEKEQPRDASAKLPPADTKKGPG